jgi:hypothetical protein
MEPGLVGSMQSIDFNHLVHQMVTAVESPAFADSARIKGPTFVAAGYTWQHVARRLLGILFDSE